MVHDDLWLHIEKLHSFSDPGAIWAFPHALWHARWHWALGSIPWHSTTQLANLQFRQGPRRTPTYANHSQSKLGFVISISCGNRWWLCHRAWLSAWWRRDHPILRYIQLLLVSGLFDPAKPFSLLRSVFSREQSVFLWGVRYPRFGLSASNLDQWMQRAFVLG